MLDKKTAIQAIQQLKAENIGKRKFQQKFDLIFSLKDFNIKKGDKVDDYVVLPNPIGRNTKICAFVGNELETQAKKLCDTVVLIDEFDSWASKKREIRKLVRRHHFFIAQANIMPKIAQTFGKYLGSVGKMPNPKLGLVVSPTGNLSEVIEKVRKTVLLDAKKQPNIHTIIGNQDSDEEMLWQNIHTIEDRLLHILPKGKNQIRQVTIKMTMSKPIKLV